jgi:hypothetical protein
MYVRGRAFAITADMVSAGLVSPFSPDCPLWDLQLAPFKFEGKERVATQNSHVVSESDNEWR